MITPPSIWPSTERGFTAFPTSWAAAIFFTVLLDKHGATAEELAVFELADAEAAGALLDALRARNAEREESYAGYLPDEVPKLQNTLLLSNGRYVLLCTAPDTAGAREAWDAAFEG